MSLSELARLRDRFKAKGSQAAASSLSSSSSSDAARVPTSHTHVTHTHVVPANNNNNTIATISTADSGITGMRYEVFKTVRTSVHRCLATSGLLMPIDVPSLYRRMKRVERRPDSAAADHWLSDSKAPMIPAIERVLRDLLTRDIIELTDSHSNIITATTSSSGALIVTRVHVAKLIDAYSDAITPLGHGIKRTSVVPLSSTTGDDIPSSIKRARLEATTSGTSSSTTKLEPIALSDDKTVKLERLTPSNDSTTAASDTSSLSLLALKAERSLLTNSNKAPKDDNLRSLLDTQSFKDRAFTALGQEILDLVTKPSAQDLLLAGKFKTTGGPAVILHCPHGTKDACCHERRAAKPCDKVHWIQLIQPHTDRRLGDCSYLNACRHLKTCKFVHYEIDQADLKAAQSRHSDSKSGLQSTAITTHMAPPIDSYAYKYGSQFINCDIRKFEFPLLGEFPIIMADPPWDIHMELPYGTMLDDEMLKMNVKCLQKDGVIFLWVTGRAMELGRRCLDAWGYQCTGELLWIKTNQLQRLIRTGRTGHWLNHSKEHCIIGVKGDPPINRNIDCDIIVSEVRETSRKPDEVYGILERLSPGARKLEIFGRPHNTRPGWITLGNQLNGTRLTDPEVAARYEAAYPGRPYDNGKIIVNDPKTTVTTPTAAATTAASPSLSSSSSGTTKDVAASPTVGPSSALATAASISSSSSSRDARDSRDSSSRTGEQSSSNSYNYSNNHSNPSHYNSNHSGYGSNNGSGRYDHAPSSSSYDQYGSTAVPSSSSRDYNGGAAAYHGGSRGNGSDDYRHNDNSSRDSGAAGGYSTSYASSSSSRW